MSTVPVEAPASAATDICFNAASSRVLRWSAPLAALAGAPGGLPSSSAAARKAPRSTSTLILISAAFLLLTPPSTAGSIDYDTTGTTLSCNGVSGCVQNSAASITAGGLTLTYDGAAGSGIATPSLISLGNMVATGSGAVVDLTGLVLVIHLNSTPPGVGGEMPSGMITGVLSTDTSGAAILFTPNNTSTAFGTLPGIVIVGSAQVFTYQVINPLLGIVAPSVGLPAGVTVIEGAVTETTSSWVAEPSTFVLLGAGLSALGLLFRRRMP